ncbi:MAG: pyrroloquinoline quinone-dependent dehydrogenase, partial [Gemmatimonadota bacterium]|nr:pyrroloquinoline quinone-dependent dehydrogenase [Gemmatimonadota bacterium]
MRARRCGPLRAILLTLAAAAAYACQPTTDREGAPGTELAADDWPVYGGDPGGTKYSTLADIDRSNVDHLVLAWTWDTEEDPVPAARTPFREEPIAPGSFQATPLVIDDTMYVVTPYSRVVALDAETGSEIWSYDPRAWEFGNLHRGCRFCHRGIAAWTDGVERRILLNTRWRLIALDASTGEPIPTFGTGGEVDLAEGLIWEPNRLHISHTSPAVVFEDLVIVGGGAPDDRVYRNNPPGDIQAFDVRTGERVWSFHTIPQPGELGNETWEDESWSFTGSTNVWAPFTLDADRGLVYLPVGTPNNDFYGGHRKGDNLFAESVLCLNARTGERVWHFQAIHHGLWDYDLPAPPNLVTIEVEGRSIDAVVVLTKTAFAYVFDRVTGEPVWPIEERPVPASDVPGERASPTQPFPTKPPPLTRQGITEDDLLDFTPELRALALDVFQRHRSGPIFTPPSLEGTILYPGLVGGAGWGGGAVDPETGVLYVKGTNWPWVARVAPPEPGTDEADYIPVFFTPLDVEGLPLTKPPYSMLIAVDLNQGETLWEVPFGDTPEFHDHPRLAGLELPPMGVAPGGNGSPAGPLLTGGGLVFMAGGGRQLLALDAEDGTTLWGGDLEGRRGFANP